jgi:hypothetical protein
MPSDMIADFGHIGRYPSEDHDATLTVRRNAHDAADARRILTALGLLPDTSDPEPSRPADTTEQCVRCQRPLFRGRQAPVGFVRHSSRGLCTGCRSSPHRRTPEYRAKEAAAARARRTPEYRAKEAEGRRARRAAKAALAGAL